MQGIDHRLLLMGLAMVVLMYSCGENPSSMSDLRSFDLKGLADGQVTTLSQGGYRIQKISQLGPSQDKTEYRPDSSGWKRELDILRNADISKPGLRPYYSYTNYDSVDLIVEHYALTDTGQSDVIYQKVYHHKNSGLLWKIEVLQQVNNPIYNSSRIIQAIFREEDNQQMLLDSLKVKGFQHMIISDTTFYQTTCKILK